MLFAVIMLAMAFLFAFVVAICAAGGALGARYVGRKSNRPA
jgi:Na+-driven multidrug efflux pump